MTLTLYHKPDCIWDKFCLDVQRTQPDLEIVVIRVTQFSQRLFYLWIRCSDQNKMRSEINQSSSLL